MTILELARLVQGLRTRQDAYNYAMTYTDAVPNRAELAEVEAMEKQVDATLAAILASEESPDGRMES